MNLTQEDKNFIQESITFNNKVLLDQIELKLETRISDVVQWMSDNFYTKEEAASKKDIERLEVRLENIEQRLEKLEKKIEIVEKRLIEVEQRLDKVEQRLDDIEIELTDLRDTLTSVNSRLHLSIGENESKYIELDNRISKLEKKIL